MRVKLQQQQQDVPRELNSSKAPALSGRVRLHSWRKVQWRPLLSENTLYKA